MTWQYSPVAIAMVVAACICLLFANYAWQRRSVPAASAFTLLMLAVTQWCLMDALEASTVETSFKIFWSKLSYIGIVCAAPLWLLFVWDYTRQTRLLASRWRPLLWVVPSIVLLLTITNEFHGLIWPSTTPIVSGLGVILLYAHGPGVWLEVVYSYLLLIVGAVQLVRTVTRPSRTIYRGQVMCLVAGAVCPWVASAAYLAKLNPLPGIELTPFGFAAMGLFVGLGLFGFRLFDIVPVAHDLLFASMVDAALVLDARGRIVEINLAARNLLGLTEAALGADAASALAHYPDLVSQICTGALDANHVLATDIPGRYFDLRMSLLGDTRSRLNGKLVVLRDITELRLAQDAQRLASVGQLAAGVAHEFNNILAIIMMRAELTQMQNNVREYEKLAELVLRTGQRGADICRSLTALARPKPPQRTPISIQDVIDGALALTAQHIDQANVTVVHDYDAGGWQVMGDAGQLEQVFLNLLLNACHAMPEGGTLTVRTRYDAHDGGKGRVIASVSDTGVGISVENQARIFEPFFTTKGRLGGSDVPGTGLGLSVAHGIIRAHDGTIEVRSVVGEGTQMAVSLAAYEPVSKPETASRPADTMRLRANFLSKVLLVEDEIDLADLIRTVLIEAGYQITHLTSATPAVAALTAQSFDLVITDWMMPNGGGRAVLQAAHSLDKAPRVIVITGAADCDLNDEPAKLGASQCLRKPFATYDLLKAVQRATIPADTKASGVA